VIRSAKERFWRNQVNQWFREPGDAEELIFGGRRALEQRGQRRELLETVSTGIIATIIVFLAGMAFTNRDELPRYYPGCRWAEFVGAAPIARGDKGYREALDPDGDGLACEAYQVR
jgi:hypothetical protein